MDDNFLLPTLVYGCEKPEIRFRTHQGRQLVFCLQNGNLHLTRDDLVEGTFEMGSFLGALCKEHCLPKRDALAPCPAFVRSHMVGKDDHKGARVRRDVRGSAVAPLSGRPDGARCRDGPGGAVFLRRLPRRPLERRAQVARPSRPAMERALAHGRERLGENSRTAKFDRMIWATIRYPALIPQVWLNWLYAAPDDLVKTLDRRPSRVDFVAFANGKRHVIEIDGLSHYAAFDEVTRSYSPDEREYARNLRIERWLRFDGWEVTRIGRHEVSEVIRNENDDFLPAYGLLRVLPFGSDYPMQPSATGLGLGSIDYAVRVPAGNLDWDDIPVLEDDPPF